MQLGKPIAYASRALTDTEERYAQIEKEMLAIVFSLEKYNQYTFGWHLKVHSDRKPLEAIMKKTLSRVPCRLQGMMMRLQKYEVEVSYERGSQMYIADTLSRAYLNHQKEQQDQGFDHINMAKFLSIPEQRLQQIKQEMDRDEALQALRQVVLQRWPEQKSDQPP